MRKANPRSSRHAVDYPGTCRARTVPVAGAVLLRVPLPPSCEISSGAPSRGAPHIAGRPAQHWIPRRLPFKERAIHMGSPFLYL